MSFIDLETRFKTEMYLWNREKRYKRFSEINRYNTSFKSYSLWQQEKTGFGKKMFLSVLHDQTSMEWILLSKALSNDRILLQNYIHLEM